MEKRKPHLDENNSTKEFRSKPEKLQESINDALSMIEDFGIPLESVSPRMKEKTAMDFLALTDMRVGEKWKDAKDIAKIKMKTREILTYVNEHFEEKRSSGSYDDVRRKELKPLTLAEIVQKSKPDAATNDSTRGYGIAKEMGI